MLKEKNVTFDVRYFGINDLSTNWSIKVLIENSNEIIAYYTHPLSEIATFDDYIDYLVLKKIHEMEETISYIVSTENKTIFRNIVESLNSIYLSIQIGDVIKFINANYDKIFSKNDQHFLADVTIDIIIEYQNGISDSVFNYLIKCHSYLVIDNYENLQKTIERNKTLFNLLFSGDIIRECFDYRLDKIIEIIMSIKIRHQTDLFEQINDVIEEIIAYGNRIVTIIDVKNSFEYRNIISEIFDFLKRLEHIKATDYEQHLVKADMLLNEYLKYYGKSFEFTIPVEDIIKQLKSDLPWELKLLSLTHSLKKHENTLESNFENSCIKHGSILDLVSTNIPVNEFFTLSVQQNLKMQITIGSVALTEMLKDEVLHNESYSWYNNYILYICDKLNYTSNDLNMDLNLIFQMITNIYYNLEKVDEQIKQSLYYGTCMFICAFTEKLLRVTYKYNRLTEEYVPENNCTMGKLLADENILMKQILGENQMRCLRYFFCIDKDNKVGLNYRNRLAHWQNLSCSDLNEMFTMELFYLFTCVINSIFYYFYEKDRIEKRKQSNNGL